MSPENPNPQGRSHIGERLDPSGATMDILAAACLIGTFDPTPSWKNSSVSVFSPNASSTEQFPFTD